MTLCKGLQTKKFSIRKSTEGENKTEGSTSEPYDEIQKLKITKRI